MTASTCVICGAPTPDGYACVRETRRAAGHLREIGDSLTAARDIAHGQARLGETSGGPGHAGPRMELDLAATARLDAIQRELGGLARIIGEERHAPIADVSHWDDPIEGLTVRIGAHLEWLRHHPAVDEHYAVIAACARVLRGIVAGPAAQKFLGPCGAPRRCEGLEPDDWPEGDCGNHEPHDAHDREPCDGDVYGRSGSAAGRCKTCGAEYDQGARRAWLDGEVRQYAYTAKEISDAYGLNVNTIRSWLHRGLLVAHGEMGGRPLLNLGQVLDLAVADAARRETYRAERARRKEQAA